MNRTTQDQKGFVRRHLRGLAFLALLSGGPSLTGCYGHFPLTHGIYNINGAVGGDSMMGKVVQTLVFWVFVIIPVYGIGMFLDAIVFNLIEFWTGNSISMSEADDGHGMHASLVPSADGQQAKLTITQNGKAIMEQRFVKVSPTEFEVRDARQRVVGRVFNDGKGKLRLTDAKSRTLRVIDAGEGNPLTTAMGQPAVAPAL